MLLASSAAFGKTVGLLITFIGIGILVNIIIVFILVVVAGEHAQNKKDQTSARPPGA